MRRVRLGSWHCASGNGVDVFLVGGLDGIGSLVCEWDACPPLAEADRVDYEETILPAAIQRAQEYLEIVGPALVVLA